MFVLSILLSPLSTMLSLLFAGLALVVGVVVSLKAPAAYDGTWYFPVGGKADVPAPFARKLGHEVPEDEEAEATSSRAVAALPDDFPGLEHIPLPLRNPDTLRALPDAVLLALDGIGEATLKKIRAALAISSEPPSETKSESDSKSDSKSDTPDKRAPDSTSGDGSSN